MEQEELQHRLAQLKAEHGDLDTAIATMSEKTPYASVQLQRLKKRKLAIKDEISRILDKLTPDIIA
jgi:hypothetical protein